MHNQRRVSVVIPALNEAASIGLVITDLQRLYGDEGRIIDEIVMCDNGSSDGTAEIAKGLGARVVTEPLPGYGRACLKAITALREPDIVLFTDADHSFYAQQAIPLIEAVVNGADLAIGSRTLGCMQPGALTVPQRFGNALASLLIKLIWGYPVSDLGPFRAISYRALNELAMTDKTFGWTIEMQIKAIMMAMPMVEVPVDTRCRIGVSKISGTLKGTIGAGVGILGMIARLWRQQQNVTAETKLGEGK